ncbi:hypothetical protein [Mycobacterium sp.]|uniref:hypothetical protein n=1 Tax=Mycobacterium sp. TaxID=1785 RepID=UPI003C761F69
MRNSLTDHGDPEKRIAELEHRLVEQKRGAEPPTPHDAATSQRFVASAAPPTAKQTMKYTYVLTFAGMASLRAVYMAASRCRRGKATASPCRLDSVKTPSRPTPFPAGGCCVREQQPGFGPHIAMLAKRTGCWPAVDVPTVHRKDRT